MILPFFCLIALAFVTAILQRAPEGAEDEAGFHYGRAKVN